MALERSQTLAYITNFPSCARDITPHDTNPLTNYQGQPQPQTVYVTGAGNVSVVPAGNDVSQFVIYTIAAGGVVPVICSHVRSTSTTATGLIGHY